MDAMHCKTLGNAFCAYEPCPTCGGSMVGEKEKPLPSAGLAGSIAPIPDTEARSKEIDLHRGHARATEEARLFLYCWGYITEDQNHAIRSKLCENMKEHGFKPGEWLV